MSRANPGRERTLPRGPRGTAGAWARPMRRVLVVVALGLATAPVLAQPAPPEQATISVTAKVIDATTGKPIRRARIEIEGTTDGTQPDKTGAFSLAGVPLGATLVVTAAGYDAVLVTADQGELPDVAMVPSGIGEVIDVAGEAPPAAVGATTLDRNEVSKIPGSGNDLLAGLDALPGITSGPAGSPTSFNGVVIRGSAPEDSKILVDGFEIPFLYHTVGFRSVLPTESIDALEYLPGGFDVAYGRASSGIIAVTTRGGTPKLGGHAELSVIDGGLLAQGPAGARGNYLIAMRRSTIDLILPSLIPEDADINLATVPRYYDLQARFDYDLYRWRLAFSLLGSDDLLQLYADDERDPDQRFYLRSRFLRATATARWAHDNLSAVIAVSPVIQNLVFEFGRNQFLEMVATGVGARTEVTRTAPDTLGLTEVVSRVGAEVNIGRARLDLALPKAPDEGQPMAGPPDDDDIEQRFTGVKWVPDVAAWVATSANLDPRVRLTAGLRVDGFLRSSDVEVQPRGELAVKLPRKNTVRLAAGAYRRPAEYQAEFLDDTLAPEKATQLILGLEHGPTRGVKLQASAYYTDRTKLITFGDDGKLHNSGRGTTYGGELLAILRSGGWFGWVSYTLTRSTRVDQPGARRRLFDYDQPHDLNVALSWKNKKWQLGGRFSMSSGQPITPVLGSIYDSDKDAYIPVYGDVNTDRVQLHHQLDIRIDRMWKLGAMKLSVFLDVQNVYLNSTVAGYGYSFDYSERFEFKSIPILPSLGLRGEL
jgi:hypothetical protein